MTKKTKNNMNEVASQEQQFIVCQQCPEQSTDEISLFDLWQSIAAKKTLIFTITAFFFIASILYVLLLTKTPNVVWQAKIQFAPSQLKDIQELNLQYVNIQTFYTPISVYNRFLLNYQSANKKRKFLENKDVANYYDVKLSEKDNVREKQINQLFSRFNESLKLNLPKGKSDIYFISSTFEFSNAQQSSELLNQYAQMIIETTIDELVQEVSIQIKQKQDIIKERISIKKIIAKQIREKRILELNESIKIAKLLNLEDRKLLTTTDNNIARPLYYQGYKLLEAEKKVLEERKDDTPFINGLSTLKYLSLQLTKQLKGLLNKKETFRVAIIDQKAVSSKLPIKSNNKKAIIVISTILGFILSLLIILIFNLFEKYNEQLNSK